MAFVIVRDILSVRWASMAITLCSLLLVLVATLNPYNFNFTEAVNNGEHSFIILGPGKYDTRDIIQNILLFLPLGFSLTVYLTQTIRSGALTALFVIILISFGLSYSVEVLQMFLPSRFPSLSDVLSNSTGCILGFLCFFCEI